MKGTFLMNIAVAQSGGPTCAINASLLGVFRHATKYDEIETVFGSVNGIEGLIYDNLVNLIDIIADDNDVELIRQTPSTVLGSCRYKLPDPAADSAVYERIVSTLKSHDISAFFYIGGNDSMDTVSKLSAVCSKFGWDMNFIGVPKTIDNDLAVTDHTPGYGSCAKFIATVMSEMLCDTAVYTVKAVTIVEIMGRDTGWLTASSALAAVNTGVAPDYIYLPERDFEYEAFFKDIEEAFKKHPNIVIAVSEGLHFADGRLVGEDTQSGAVDVFGHKYLDGTGKALELAVKEKFGCKVRSVVLNLPQRCASHIASATDISEGFGVGKAAVNAAVNGESEVMMCILRNDTAEYSVTYSPVSVSKVANQIKYVPADFINEAGNGVTEECINYMLPLVRGEAPYYTKNGLPDFFSFSI